MYQEHDQPARYEYDADGDVLDIFFGENRAAWTIELTPNILISIDRTARQAIRLTFMDYTELIRPSEWGGRSFPITGLADMPLRERDLVIAILNAPPVNRWLHISVVQSLPDSPFPVMHLAPPLSELRALATVPG